MPRHDKQFEYWSPHSGFFRAIGFDYDDVRECGSDLYACCWRR